MSDSIKKVNAVVVSNSMEKTSVVSISRQIKHAKYGKYIKKTTKLLVHDEFNKQVGDKVVISPCKPLSKNKSWVIVG
jgi:small subunit ribosomal protein S17